MGATSVVLRESKLLCGTHLEIGACVSSQNRIPRAWTPVPPLALGQMQSNRAGLQGDEATSAPGGPAVDQLVEADTEIGGREVLAADSYLFELIRRRTVHPDQPKSGEKTRGPEEPAVGQPPPTNKGLDEMFLRRECDRPGAGPGLRDEMGNFRKAPGRNARRGENPPMAARGTPSG